MAGSLTEGCRAKAPYTVILLNGAVNDIPAAVMEQLADGGRLITVVDAYASHPDNTVGRATLFFRSGDNISQKLFFNAAVKPLPGFQKAVEFKF